MFALALLWIVFAIEIKQYLRLAKTLNSANQLIGEDNHKEVIRRSTELLAIYIAISLLIFFVLAVYATNRKVTYPDLYMRLLLLGNEATPFIGLLFCTPPIGLAIQGYYLYERSSRKYHHDVAVMRTNIKQCTWIVSISSLIIALNFGLQYALSSYIDHYQQDVLASSSNGISFPMVLSISFGDYIPVALLAAAIFSRINAGWDRIYLLPLTYIEPEQDILVEL
jgi:hypothetical protein